MKKVLKCLLIIAFLILSVQAGYGQTNETCIQCHEDSPINVEAYENSVHGGFECIECHTDAELNEDMEHSMSLAKVQCEICHDEAVEQFNAFQHGKVFSENYLKLTISDKFPTCADCHPVHTMLPSDNPESLLNKKNQYKMCNNCHGKEIHVNGSTLRTQNVSDEYLKSYHYESIMKTGEGASCTDCHGAHDISLLRDPNSKTCTCNLDKTCGSCHSKELEEFQKSIHYVALKAGLRNAPTCADCHTSHSVMPPDRLESPLNPANAGHYSCAKCHNNEQLIKRYGLKGERISSYDDSYHGLAAKRGYQKVAYCQDCHGGHVILPEGNPESTIHPDNLQETCQQCHQDATKEFSQSYSHEILITDKSVINTWIKRIYIFLIAAFLLFTFFHNGLVWYHFIKQKMKRIDEEPVVRMNLYERVQHTLLFLSFFVLVVSGFALRFPDADWVHLLRKILGTTEESRALIHRIAAVVLIVDSFLHLFYISFTSKGKKLFRSFIPGFKDLVDMIENIKYYLGFRKTPPVFGKFDYTEKIEYWALIWGTVVMIVTGFVLWFPAFFSNWLPTWAIRAAELIHYFEAWLATLSIIFYHFFFVIFHPEEYPMNLSWLTGKMHKEHYKEKHPGDEDIQ
ncbi:MAG: cytochrome c3 family protein [Calditrichia bacterium]